MGAGASNSVQQLCGSVEPGPTCTMLARTLLLNGPCRHAKLQGLQKQSALVLAPVEGR